MYQKEIIYMGLHKDGSRIGSAGFLKAEKRDKTSTLTMTVKNVPRSIEGRFPVRYRLGAETLEPMERADWQEEDGITLRDGGGVWEKKELEASDRIHVQILLPNGYLIEGESRAAWKQTPPKNGMAAAEPETGNEPRSVQRGAAIAEPSVEAEEKPMPAQREAAIAEPSVGAEEKPMPVQRDIATELPAETGRVTASAQQNTVMAEQGSASVRRDAFVPQRPPLMADALAIEGLKEDKWEQILDTYDQIHPYADDRVYVKIAPKDFIILSENCQHLVNNSFLLHGFYNYRYVILGKGEKDYCLGVPGVFYEREKMVALMFGFEAFECEGGDPKPGDFGYYLRKVEL